VLRHLLSVLRRSPNTAVALRRGSAIAGVEIARKLTEAIWWMLTRNQPVAPAGAL
jgi:hypothetical protein